MEHDAEPVRGLPGHLPPGERILWQGSPDAAVFATRALHVRWVAGYFAALAVLGLVTGSVLGAAITIGAGLVCLALLAIFAWAVARTTVYTLTDRRLVLRIGVALSVSFNLPLTSLSAADLRPLDRGHGDIALTIDGARIGYALLWPHARPWRVKVPVPMLRAVADAEGVAAQLARARAALGPITRATPSPVASGQRAPSGALAA